MSGLDFSDLPVLAFVLIPVVLAAAFVAGVWHAWRRSEAAPRAARAAGLALVTTVAWMAISWELALSGVLREWNRFPPPFALLVLTIVLLAVRIGLGGVGGRLARGIPLWVLVGIQGFRLPLELAMHRMFERGVMPPQMSYSGLNYDIFTGVTALVVAALLLMGRAGTRLVRLWNIIGLVLLINVVVVAILGTPAIRYFGDQHLNTWVTYVPYVWLPTVMVLAALAGHLVIFRAIARRNA